MYKTLIVSNMDKARSPSFISKVIGVQQASSIRSEQSSFAGEQRNRSPTGLLNPLGAELLRWGSSGCIQAWSACKNANGIIMLRSSSLELKGIPASQQLTYVNKQLIVPGAEDQGPLPFSYVLPPEEYELGLCGIDKGWASLIAGWQKIGYRVRVFSDASIVKPETREMLAKQKRTFCSYKTIYR